MLFEYETKRLVLRVLQPKEAGQVLDFYLRDKELFEKFEPDRMENFYTVNYQRQVLAFENKMMGQSSLFRYYVYEKEDQERIIGTISLHNINRGYFSSCEIGYKFSSEVHGRGYATEAIGEIIEGVFTQLRLHRIMAYVIPDNMPSIRLLERLEFHREGICRDYLYLQGRWQDHMQFSLLSSDYSSDN